MMAHLWERPSPGPSAVGDDMSSSVCCAASRNAAIAPWLIEGDTAGYSGTPVRAHCHLRPCLCPRCRGLGCQGE